MPAEPDGGAPPLSDRELAALRAKHSPWGKDENYCMSEDELWPCDAARLLADLDDARRALKLYADSNSWRTDVPEYWEGRAIVWRMGDEGPDTARRALDAGGEIE